jgi:glutamyl-tRNA synthetase
MIDSKAAVKFLVPEMAEPLKSVSMELAGLTADWSEVTIKAAFERVLALHNLKLGQLAQPVRVAVTGGTVSPGIFEVIAVLGRTRTIERIEAAVRRCSNSAG